MKRFTTKEKMVHNVCGPKHNSSKVKVFLVLYHRLKKKNFTTGLGVADLARQSGVSYQYIKNRIPQWTYWSYLNRSLTTKNGKPIYVYKIASRGIVYLECTIDLAWRDRYVAEIRDHQRGLLNV